MSNNRDLLTEAIADAKAVKETAIANAKAALEESFTPHLKSMLAAKLEEMDKDDDVKESEEIQETEEVVNETEDAVTETEEVVEATKQVDEEINLDEFLAELEVAEGEEKEEIKETEELDEAKEEVSESEEIDEAAPLEVTEADEDEDESEEEAEGEDSEEVEIDLEDMTEDDLKKFIEDVISDMVETGELEPGPDAEAVEGEPMDDIDMPAMEDEIELEEVEEIDEAKEEIDEAKEEVEEGKKEEIDEVANALAEVEALKTELNEVNLLNAKLLYTNKIFRSKNLTEAKKVQVLKAFDKAATVKESKVIFETLNEGLINKVSAPINEVKGSASKATGTVSVAKKPIIESDEMVNRFKKLAGII